VTITVERPKHGGRQHPETVEITGPGGQQWSLRTGQRLLFGRGPGVDLTLAANPWVSRAAGEITAFDDGIRVTNISRRHPLWLDANGDRARLPVLASGTGNIGCFLTTGRATIGPGDVPDSDQSVRVRLPDHAYGPGPWRILDPGTKEFMVAFLLCRPWLLDPLRIRPLPSAPQIAEEALALTSSYRLLKRLEVEPSRRGKLAAQVHDHLRTLRAKIRKYELFPPGLELAMPAIAAVLIHHDLIGARHLALAYDAAWLSAQEDKWWSTPG